MHMRAKEISSFQLSYRPRMMQEIMFALHPELNCARLIFTSMKHNEAFLLCGAEQVCLGHRHRHPYTATTYRTVPCSTRPPWLLV